MDAHCQTTPGPDAKTGFETRPATLREELGLSTRRLPIGHAAARDFSLKAPESFTGRIRPGDENDPLLRQIWPAPEEEIATPGFHADPVGDADATIATGLLQKYRGRALLLASGACAIHCRYCFRRHFPYREHSAEDQPWRSALRQIRSDSSLKEIILSGGDPLTLSNRRLRSLLEQLEAIPHVLRLRIHTRTPVVHPARMDASLLELLAACADRLVVVVHANHARELDHEVCQRLRELRAGGIALLNQSVLLRGINDSATRLAELSERLFACGTLPYYLHQLDPVAGAAHFHVPDKEALDIVEQLRRELPGYLVPRLVREQAGAPSKQPL